MQLQLSVGASPSIIDKYGYALWRYTRSLANWIVQGSNQGQHYHCLHMHACSILAGRRASDGLSGEERRTHSLPPDSQHCTEPPAIYVYI